MRVLFWNTHKNQNINTFLTTIIVENSISIVVLAEYADDVNCLKKSLANHGVNMNNFSSPFCERIVILSSEKNVIAGRQTKYASIQIINNEDILCCVHLPSQLLSDHQKRRNIAISRIVNDIINTENEFNTNNTIVVGDFNENPYNEGCLSAERFHGIPVSKETEREKRVVSGEEFKMFYNPMWNFFGDFNYPPGTYYYAGGNSEMPYWNIFDQVLMRPAMRHRFIDSSLKIITSTETKSLIDEKGYPCSEISDHLPIVCEIKENNHE